MSSYPTSSVLLIVIATFFGASAGPVVRWMALPSAWVCEVRFLVPALIAALTVYLRRELILPSFLEIVSSLLNFIRTWLFIVALLYTPVTIGVPIFFSWPIMSMVFAQFLLQEKIASTHVAAILLCISGVLCVFSEAFALSDSDLYGALLMVMAAFLYAVVNLLNKRALVAKSPLQVVFSQNIVGAVVLLPVLLFYPLPSDLLRIVGALYYGLAAGIISFLLYFLALRRLPTHVAAVLCYLEIVYAFILSTLFLGERPTILAIFGTALIVLGAYMVRRPT